MRAQRCVLPEIPITSGFVRILIGGAWRTVAHPPSLACIKDGWSLFDPTRSSFVSNRNKSTQASPDKSKRVAPSTHVIEFPMTLLIEPPDGCVNCHEENLAIIYAISGSTRFLRTSLVAQASLQFNGRSYIRTLKTPPLQYEQSLKLRSSSTALRCLTFGSQEQRTNNRK